MYETFDHTADLGLRARASTLDVLFAEMAEALFAAIVEDPATIAPRESVEVTIAGDERDYLLFDWLRKLLFLFEGDHWLFRRFTVRVSETGLVATAWGEPLDRSRHELSHEVKAITYHELKVEPAPEGWLAEVIVDI